MITCGKPHPLHGETAIGTCGNSSTAYIKCAVTAHGNQHPLLFEREQ